jgi:AraC-like DNA-binding protein
MPGSALEIGLHGGACALLLLIAGVLVRDYRGDRTARLGAFFALGAAAHSVASAAGFQPRMGWWAPLMVGLGNGNNVILWLLARALFDDGFKPKAWHGLLWASVAGASLVGCVWLSPAHSPLGPRFDIGLTWTALGFSLLAAAQTLASWPADLIEQRRRMRVVIVAGSAGYTALNAVARLSSTHGAVGGSAGDLAGAAGLAAVAGVVAWSLLRAGDLKGLLGATVEAPKPVAEAAQVAVLDPNDRRLVAALEHAMSHDRAYRREGLTVGQLAAMQGLTEHRLRRLINQGLGHRNFNSFLNRYRIAEARSALEDVSQSRVPILTIALDAGYNSLGPFNRAFKAETGLTPSQYRKAHGGAPDLADFEIGDSISSSASARSNPA